MYYDDSKGSRWYLHAKPRKNSSSSAMINYFSKTRNPEFIALSMPPGMTVKETSSGLVVLTKLPPDGKI